jgi:hypothetical protein
MRRAGIVTLTLNGQCLVGSPAAHDLCRIAADVRLLSPYVEGFRPD